MVDPKGYPDGLRLKAAVSLSQTRFVLSNFCLSHFGSHGQYFADIIELCSDARQLQEALNTIRAEVRSRCPERMAALAECVREANETDGDTASPGGLPRPSPPPGSPSPAPTAAPRPQEAARPPYPGSAPPAPASRPSDSDRLRLRAGVSLAQGRFTLTEFCLDQFGAKAQQLVDAINRCTDVGGLQRVVMLIGADIQANHPGSVSKLTECVREINESAD